MISLNHTVIPVSDKAASARFFADLLGVDVLPPSGKFVAVRVSPDLAFAYDDSKGAFAGHHAFLVDDELFDGILQRVRDSGAEFGAAEHEMNGEINTLKGGRGFYVKAPDDHSYEFFTA